MIDFGDSDIDLPLHMHEEDYEDHLLGEANIFHKNSKNITHDTVSQLNERYISLKHRVEKCKWTL